MILNPIKSKNTVWNMISPSNLSALENNVAKDNMKKET